MKFKRAISVLCVLTILLGVIPAAGAVEGVSHGSETELSGYVRSAYIPSVGQNSENLRTNILDSGAYEVAIEDFSFSKDTTGNFSFCGTISGTPFSVTAMPYASPANKNVQVFEASDTSSNYSVIYADIEQNIFDSALYFNDVDLNLYSNVLKLYLRPLNSADFIVIEIFTLENWAENYLSNPISEDPKDPGRVNQLWYTKAFYAPIVEEDPDEYGIEPLYVKEWASTTEYSKTYSHLGYDWKQRFSINLFISYPTSFSNFESFITGYRVIDARTECISAPNESSTVSNIEARDLRVDIAVADGCACSSFKITGELKKASSLELKINYKKSIKLNDLLSITVDYDETKPYNIDKTTKSFEGLNYYVRQFGFNLDYATEKTSLAKKGDYLNVDWTIKNYSGAMTNKPFKVRFSYVMVNLINEAGWNGQEVTKDATVYFNTTA